MTNQYTLKKGLKLFEEKAEKATMKELKQIHDLDTYPLIICILNDKESKKDNNDMDNVNLKDTKGERCLQRGT